MFSTQQRVLQLFKKPLGVVERAHYLQPLGVLHGIFRPEKPLKVLVNLKNL
jgi:hypothetical protein